MSDAFDMAKLEKVIQGTIERACTVWTNGERPDVDEGIVQMAATIVTPSLPAKPETVAEVRKAIERNYPAYLELKATQDSIREITDKLENGGTLTPGDIQTMFNALMPPATLN
jgi:hypothetical protein